MRGELVKIGLQRDGVRGAESRKDSAPVSSESSVRYDCALLAMKNPRPDARHPEHRLSKR